MTSNKGTVSLQPALLLCAFLLITLSSTVRAQDVTVRTRTSDPLPVTATTVVDLPSTYGSFSDQDVKGPKANQRAKTRAWMRSQLIPISGHDTANACCLRSGLAKALRGVSIVGLGESSHGSHELIETKSAVTKLLIEHFGFTVFAVELDFRAGQLMDAYVHGRSDDEEFALKPWDTEEFVALLRWIRHYNSAQPDSRKVSVVGVDGQDRILGGDRLIAYLEKVAPAEAAVAAPLFEDKTFPPTRLPVERARTLQLGYEELYLYLQLEGAQLIVKSSRDEYEEMLGLARSFVQPGRIYSQPPEPHGPNPRDEFMAENLRQVINRASADTKFVFWAHNGHIETSDPSNPPTGYYLRRLYGTSYFALGATFHSGEVQAWTGKSPDFKLHAYAPEPAAEDSFEAMAFDTDVPTFMIDFREVPPIGPVHDWLASPHAMKSVGAMYSPGYEHHTQFATVPLNSFDGVIFTRTSSRAIPTPRMRSKYPELP